MKGEFEMMRHIVSLGGDNPQGIKQPLISSMDNFVR